MFEQKVLALDWKLYGRRPTMSLLPTCGHRVDDTQAASQEKSVEVPCALIFYPQIDCREVEGFILSVTNNLLTNAVKH